MKNKITWEQLARYFAGELHGDKQKKMEAWIKADPNREKHINKLYKIWKESEMPPYNLNVDDAWSNLSGRMHNIDNEVNHITQTLTSFEKNRAKSDSADSDKKIKRHGTGLRRWLMAAATVIVIFTAGLLTHQFSADIIEEPVAEIENRIFETQEGERASYILVDGSKIVLHAGSRLEIPGAYNEEKRELYLEGMAYFEAAHNSEKPFVVHTKDTYTRVLGTQFLVQAWSGNVRNIEVVVSQGKVLFGDSIADQSGNAKETYITRNQRATLTGDEYPVVNDVSDLDWYVGWTEGYLKFDNRPLVQVISRLEKWYDISIELDGNDLSENRITAEIDYSQSMSEVLQGIALTLDLEIEREGRNVVFRK